MLDGGIIGLLDDIRNSIRVGKADCDLKIAQIKSRMLGADEDEELQIEESEE